MGVQTYMISNNEKTVISKMIKPEDNIIDIGGNIGEWSRAVVEIVGNVFIDICEPNPVLISVLKDIPGADVYECAMSNKFNTDVDFWVYPGMDGMSGLHRRPETEEQKFQSTPYKIKVKTYVLDRFYINPEIDFVKIDTEGNELPIIQGAEKLIKENKIKTIQFEYGLCWKEQGFKLETAFDLLESFPYRYKLPETGPIVQISEFKPEYEDYGGGGLYNYVFSKEEMK